MKVYKLFLITMLSALTALTSCSKEDGMDTSRKNVNVTFATQLPQANPLAKSVTEQFPDIEGYHIRYILEVWTAGANPELYKRIVKSAEADKTASFDVNLLSGRTFDFLLWADYVKDGANDDMHYNTSKGLTSVERTEKAFVTDERTDYSLAVTRDAFFAYKQITAEASVTENLTLKRAVAQLNIFTTDYDLVEDNFKPAYAAVSLTTTAAFNVLTQNSFGAINSDCKSYVAIKTVKEGTSPDKNKVFTGYYFTSAEGKNVVDIDVHFYKTGGSEVVTYNMTNIPLQQNYRTNVTGALLTKQGTINVETEAAYADTDTETNVPQGVPTDEGIYYSLDGSAWTKWITSTSAPVMPDGNYTSFAVMTVGENSQISSGHLTAIKNRNIEVIDLGNAKYSSVSMPNTLFDKSTTLRSFIFPQNISYMPAYFFRDCNNLVNVVLTDKMTYIGAGGFQNCTSLTEISLPESVTTLKVMAFRDCKNLKTINLSKIEEYEQLAFSGCEKLAIDVSFPNNMTIIPNSLFVGCKSLRSVTLHEGLTQINYNAFSECSSLSEITLPASIDSIEYGAFSGCSISEIALPANVTYLSPRMFRMCKKLESVTFANNITYIGSETFRGTNLKSITIPGTVSTLIQVAFADMPNLKTAVIEEGANPLTFGLGFFYQDTALTSVTFPSNTKAFDNRVLLGCYKLKEIYCNAMQAPSVKFEDFGMVSPDGRNFLAGLNVAPGEKKLIVPQGATGYEDDTQADGSENYWKTVLLNPEKCGYTIEYR